MEHALDVAVLRPEPRAHVVDLDGPTARLAAVRSLGHDRPRVGAHLDDLANDPAGEVEAVRAVLDEDATARPRALHLPVERRSGVHELGILAVDHEAVHAPDVAVVDELAEPPEGGAVAKHEAELGDDAGAAAACTRSAASGDRAREGLLAQDGQARLERRRATAWCTSSGATMARASSAEIEELPMVADGAGDAERVG